jgi:hypothetical protein
LEEEEKEDFFQSLRMKTLRIIDDDISDIEGSIDKGHFSGRLNELEPSLKESKSG